MGRSASYSTVGMQLLVRAAQILATLLAVSILVFLIQTQIPGDAAQLRVGPRPDLSPQARAILVAQARRELGLDRPLAVRYALWLSQAVRLNFGADQDGQSVNASLGVRLWPSLEVGIAAILLAVPVGIGLALVAVRHEGALWTGAIRGIVVTGFVVPSFWIGILLILVFAVWLGVLPASGYVSPQQDLREHLRHLVLPTVTLALSQVAIYFRYVEQGLRTAMRSQYARSARARGLSEWDILRRHALPNALLPMLTIVGIILGGLIGGVVIIENVFAWPGVGALLLYALGRLDYNTVVAIVLCTAAGYILISMGIDMLYRILDPRIRRA